MAQKLRDAVGTIGLEDSAAPTNIEWELGRSRTNPFDLKVENKQSTDEVEDLIRRIVEDSPEKPDQQIGYFDKEVNAYRIDPLREHELKKVMLDAADITVLP